MTFTVETDGAGQKCIKGTEDGRTCFLVLGHVMYDRTHGHAFTIDPQVRGLQRLSPWQADALRWYESKQPRGKPDIFAGEPVYEEPAAEQPQQAEAEQ